MSRMLVVASGTVSPLSTSGPPLPVDGQPVWWRCSFCGARSASGSTVSHRYIGCTTAHVKPLPFTVARWEEVPVDVDERVAHALVRAGSVSVTRMMAARGGAVTALVEVVGPSHHADECMSQRDPLAKSWVARNIPSYCEPDADPDGWHTPTGAVTVLDVPIPCERPPWCEYEGPFVPAESWWADLDVEVTAD